MNNVNITYSNGGLGTPAVGEDFISGMLFYADAYPSGFSSGAKIKNFLSLNQAEAAGINLSYSDETPAAAEFTVTNKGAAGEQILVLVSTNLPIGTVNFGTYTLTSADVVSTTTCAQGIADYINAGTYQHGFTSVAGTASFTVVCPPGYGVYPNNPSNFYFSYGFFGSVTFAATFAQPAQVGGTDGVAGTTATIHYHVSEYFRANPTGNLWVMITTDDSTVNDYEEITTLQNAAQGKIRQVGVFETINFATANLTKIQTVLDVNTGNNKPLEAIYQANFSNVADLSTLTDLASLTNPNVSVTIGQDGAADGAFLYKSTAKSVGCMGLLLGAVSSAVVSESVAWPAKFQMASGEMDTLAFANGALYNNQSDNLISNIDSKRYVFLRKFVGLGGSYFNNDYTANLATSDYTRIRLNRTIHKAARNVRGAMLPNLSSPLKFNSDGTLSVLTINYFKNVCNTALGFMVSASEISQYNTIIDASQNVLSTNELNITIQIIPIGAAETISINLGFVLSI
jgi:hypothetical protein